MLVAGVLALPLSVAAQVVNYDIAYVRSPRQGDNNSVVLPEVFDPVSVPPGTDLMLLHPNGTEEVLVAGGNGAIVDPFPSFDGQWIFYSQFHDQRTSAINTQRCKGVSRAGSDIYKINVTTRQIVRLTAQEWTPPTGTADWSSNLLSASAPNTHYLGYGIFNLGPTPIPGGKIMFSSSRNSHLPTKGFTCTSQQLFVMDEDGKNVELVTPMTLGSALHPTILKDGRVMFSSYESQGLRDRRLWGLWAIWPDGRVFEPLMSAFGDSPAFHFQGQLSSGDIVVTQYYNLNNNGMGNFLAFPPKAPAGVPPFGSPNVGDSSNPGIPKPAVSGNAYTFEKFSFSPKGLYGLTQFAHGQDAGAFKETIDAAKLATYQGTWWHDHVSQTGKTWWGKVSHPSGAPGNDLLMTWSSGPANDLDRPVSLPAYDMGLYLLRNAGPTTAAKHPKDLVRIKDSPAYNEFQPKAVTLYYNIYGVSEPTRLSWLPNDGSASMELPAGSPFGLVGTSSFYKRDTAPSTAGAYAPGALSQMGGDIGTYASSDIHAVRIITLEPTIERGYGPGMGTGRVTGFVNAADERMRILGEIPLRKFDAQGNPIMDVDGNPDTSFLAKIPADVPFTFQTIDKDGLALNIAQTWHQVRPGEVRNNCGGCHAHAHVGTDFAVTAAAKPGYVVRDLTKGTPRISKDLLGNPTVVQDAKPLDVEFYKDIQPILNGICINCHSVNNPNPPAGLVFDDGNAYRTLTAWAGTSGSGPDDYGNSKYVEPFQSRRSLLAWKVFGRVLDGSNTAFPGTQMPPPNSGFTLTADQKMTIARWIDLGAPMSFKDTQQIQWETRKWGWFMDSLRPTVAVSSPRAGVISPALNTIRIGLADYYSGLNMSTFSVKADIAIDGFAAGTELASRFQETSDHVWTWNLTNPLREPSAGTLTVIIRDNQGNRQTIARRFSVKEGLAPAAPGALRLVVTP